MASKGRELYNRYRPKRLKEIIGQPRVTTLIKAYIDSDRYVYDFGHCTSKKGWAQVDTGQDASYYMAFGLIPRDL